MHMHMVTGMDSAMRTWGRAGAMTENFSIALLARSKAQGIEIPYPQREVRLVGKLPDGN